MRPVIKRTLEHIKQTSDQPNIDIVPVLEKELEHHHMPQYLDIVKEYEIEKSKRKSDVSIWDIRHPIDILSDYTPHKNAHRTIGFAMMYLYDAIDDIEEKIRLKSYNKDYVMDRETELMLMAVALLKDAAAMLRDTRQAIYDVMYASKTAK